MQKCGEARVCCSDVLLDASVGGGVIGNCSGPVAGDGALDRVAPGIFEFNETGSCVG